MTEQSSEYGHWDVSLVGDFNSYEFFGFIYEIEEIDTGRLYIGRRQFRTKTKSRITWREYTSSSEELCSLIRDRGKQHFAFRIIMLCVGKCQLTYEEESLQFKCDVLRSRLDNGEKTYFNK